MDNIEFQRKYEYYNKIRFTNPEQALILNHELYEEIFEVLGSIERNPDYTNTKKTSKSKIKLGNELVNLCNELELIKNKLSKKNKKNEK